MSNYYTDLEFLKNTILDVYDYAITSFDVDLFDKSEFDEVTTLDYEIEKKLISLISEYMPDSQFLSEEFNPNNQIGKRTWVIDPIDGTCNLAHGIDLFGIQCALFEDGDLKLSAIYFPFSGEMFTAIKGEGAWLNEERIHCTAREINRSIISFGDYVHANREVFELEHRIMDHVSGIVERVRMVGAASMDLAYAACGRIDGNFTFISNPWDIAPGILLCREAGLIITDAYGRPFSGDSETLAVFSSDELKEACMGYQSSVD